MAEVLEGAYGHHNWRLHHSLSPAYSEYETCSMRSFNVGSLRTRPFDARPFTVFYLPLPTCLSFEQRGIDCLVDSSLEFSRSYLNHIGSSNSASSTHHCPVVEKSINVSSNDNYL